MILLPLDLEKLELSIKNIVSAFKVAKLHLIGEASPTYVHEHKEKNEFIFELIQLLLKPDTSLETVTFFL